MPQDWVSEVLDFWFGELGPADWFARSDATDAKISARFLPLWEKLSADVPADVASTPEGAVAAVLVLDQFPRNMFRGEARAFSTDTKALAISKAAIAAGLDAALDGRRRQFLYLPFMHAEDLADQQRSVELVASLPDFGNPAQDPNAFAIAHRDVIARFGRFPHRNAALGRATTPEEAKYLETHPGW